MSPKTCLLSFFIITSLCYTQRENALPPGPSKISGRVIDADGSAISNAKITVLYPDNLQGAIDTFYSNPWGYFTVYIFRYDQAYIDLQIMIEDKLCQKIRYHNTGMGMNLGMMQREFICKP